MNNNWHKKEKPLLGLTGLGGGVDGLAVVGAASKPYVDDVFSTYLYTGNASARSFSTGTDMSKGGFTFIKSRSNTFNGNIFSSDVVNGSGVFGCLQTTDNDAADYSNTGGNAMLTAFNNDGFSLGADGATARVNGNTYTYGGWSFAKKEGFCDIVTYTGNGSNRLIDHSLGSVPGMMIVKCTSEARDWVVWHRNLETPSNYAAGYTSGDYYLKLNEYDARSSIDTNVWDRIDPTATQFKVGTSDFTNKDGETYMAIIFAGAESASISNSVTLDGTGDWLSVGPSSDFTFGTGDFTIEGWFKKDNTTQGGFWQIGDVAGGLDAGSAPATAWTASDWQMYGGGDNWISKPALVTNTWFHVAQVRSSGVSTMYVNGRPVIIRTDTHDYNDTTYMAIGGYYADPYLHEGKVSNVRVVKGTAVYTEAFKPELKPLENISGTVLLCCNQSTTTGSTVSPTTITAHGNPTASKDSPNFNDADSFKFGANEDQTIISCGNYTGTGSPGVTIPLGFEPQLVLIKNTSRAVTNWALYDSMRGIVTDGDDYVLAPNSQQADAAPVDFMTLSGLGFTIETTSHDDTNQNGDNYVYMAIRRPDGLVGKPASAGTDVFAMDTGASSTTIPNFDSGFPVDFALRKNISGNVDWISAARLTGSKYLIPNDNSAISTTNSWFTWDSNLGWATDGTNQNSWMWKRGQGFDFIAYKGDGIDGRAVQHSMNQAPEMIWIKSRNLSGNNGDWIVGHKDLNGGSSPWNYYLVLNKNQEEYSDVNPFNNSAPTAGSFELDSWDRVNAANDVYVAILFSSVTGISKVGSYAGSGSTQTITTGFQPRFIIVRPRDNSLPWYTLDTTRGWASGNDEYLRLNTTDAQVGTMDWGEPTATGFTMAGNAAANNESGLNYIYYAHA